MSGALRAPSAAAAATGVMLRPAAAAASSVAAAAAAAHRRSRVAPAWSRSRRGAQAHATAQLDMPPRGGGDGSGSGSGRSSSNGGGPTVESERSKLRAVHAKIAAARELARRLAEEKQAIVAAAKTEDGALLVRSTEEAAAAAAQQAAKADALARRLAREDGAGAAGGGAGAGGGAAIGREQLARLRAENDALKALLLEMAADRRAAQERLSDLQARMAELAAPAAAAPAPAAAAAPAPAAAAAAAVPAAAADQLLALASAARARGDAAFFWPQGAGGATPGAGVRLFYDRAAGPLPRDAHPQVKAGLNKWEDIALYDMQRCGDLSAAPDGQEWWEVTVQLPRDLFRLDYVVVDAQTGAVDNNKARDYALPLVGGPSEQEVLDARAAAYAEAEAARRELLREAEDLRWAAAEELAADAADAARREFRAKRARELEAEARALVERAPDAALASLGALKAKDGVYAWGSGGSGGKEVMLRPGAKVLFAYNCRAGPLAHTNAAKLHLGVDGWRGKQKTVFELPPLDGGKLAALGVQQGGASWCGAEVEVPKDADVLDFVLSDRDERTWDNNRGADYHTLVEHPPPDPNQFDKVLKELTAAAAEADAAAEERAAARAARRVESKARVARRRREAQGEVLYTVPAVPRAGEPCDVHYNPTRTPLRGRPEVYVSGGFNRWRHPARHGPTLLQPTMKGGLGFARTTIDVPPDAHALDLVFRDAAGAAGFVDDNGGLDYHVPVEGAAGPAPALRVVHVAVEMAPIAKVGGMGDVVTALGRAVQEEGHSVEVIVPKYDVINYNLVEGMAEDGSFFWEGSNVKVWRGRVEGLNTTFLEPDNGHFWRGCIYGRGDDHVRFGYFCGAALEYLKVRNVGADVVHCHDWQSAPVAWGNRGGARCVFTIHNLNYGADLVGRAMAACDVATTVSPTYAREISGAPAIAPHLGKMYGIRNGIDQDIWDPAADEFVPVQYGPENWREGKAAARDELRRRMGLCAGDVPIVAVVTRLVHQKGIHLIKHAAWRALERGAQFVLLGSAPDGRVQGEFNALRDQLARQYPERAALWFTYDEPLSHLIFAASDMFLVPSIFEPCGLTQMVAMRYGSIPVVRRTGGLADTVFDVDHDAERAAAAGLETNGFSFESTDTAGMDYALNRALSMWYADRAAWADLVTRVMAQDWSWDDPAFGYVSLYYKATKRV